MAASIGCAVHCAAMPFLIAYLPALGLSFLADEAFHKWMAVGCFVIALTAFIPGLRKHGRLTPVIIGSVGLVMTSIAAFGFAGECCTACGVGATSAASTHAKSFSDASCPHCASKSQAAASGSDILSPSQCSSLQPLSPEVRRIITWLTPLGGIVLVSVHLLNRRYGCLCGCCSQESAEGTV
ncbi:MAG: MerC domain-containing protein [Pirellulales bacterium]